MIFCVCPRICLHHSLVNFSHTQVKNFTFPLMGLLQFSTDSHFYTPCTFGVAAQTHWAARWAQPTLWKWDLEPPACELRYCISLIRRYPRIVAAQLGAPSKINPQIVAAATMRRAQTCILIIPTDASWAISWAVRVLRLVSTADSRTERLRILLPASIRPSYDHLMYLINHRCYPPDFQWATLE